jgi:hypothetical protein
MNPDNFFAELKRRNVIGEDPSRTTGAEIHPQRWLLDPFLAKLHGVPAGKRSDARWAWRMIS